MTRLFSTLVRFIVLTREGPPATCWYGYVWVMCHECLFMVWGRFSGWLIVAWVDGTVQVARASGPFCSSVCGRWRFQIKNGPPTPLHLVPDVGALYCWGLFVDAPMGSQSPPGNSNEPSVAPYSVWNVRMMIFFLLKNYQTTTQDGVGWLLGVIYWWQVVESSCVCVSLLIVTSERRGMAMTFFRFLYMMCFVLQGVGKRTTSLGAWKCIKAMHQCTYVLDGVSLYLYPNPAQYVANLRFAGEIHQTGNNCFACLCLSPDRAKVCRAAVCGSVCSVAWYLLQFWILCRLVSCFTFQRGRWRKNIAILKYDFKLDVVNCSFSMHL